MLGLKWVYNVLPVVTVCRTVLQEGEMSRLWQNGHYVHVHCRYPD